MKEFDELGLDGVLLRALDAQGYQTPTPIQAAAIPSLMDGRDLMGIAQTGTGKTASFVLPLLDRLAKRQLPRPAPKSAHAVILAPTRELAGQIQDSITALAGALPVKTALVVGGVKHGPQIKALAPGCDIVIATPGRLEDHMATGAVRLAETVTLVLDEADQMLDLGFKPAIKRIAKALHPDRQTVMFSATMPKPIAELAKTLLRTPKEVSVAPQSTPIERIDQSVLPVAAEGKRDRLVDVLSATEVGQAIVFTRTKRGADRVARHLVKAGLKADAIHGDRSQGQRDRAIQGFKAGKLAILVATDIAARGLDIDDVSHVVNFDLPLTPEVYVHRIGRTARAGRSGAAISFCTPEERPQLRAIEKLTGIDLGGGGLVPAQPAPRTPAGRPQAQKPGARRPRRARTRQRSQDGDRDGLDRVLAP